MIKHTSDVNEIKSAIVNIYDEMRYDNSPNLDQYVPQGVWFILYEQNSIAGVINLEQLNNVTWSPNIFIHENYRGNESTKWGQQVIDYMRKIGAKNLLAFTPYKQAKRYAEKLGFKQLAITSKSILKNGKLMDQYILEKQL